MHNEEMQSEVKVASKPRLIYLTSEYPHISHTFIRREILGLERRGYDIVRVAIRSGIANQDKDDEIEARITHYILGGSRWQSIKLFLDGLIKAKFKVLRTISALLQFAQASYRGSIRQFGYLSEALVLLSICREHNIDHVHVHFGTNPATVAYLCKLMGGPSYSMTIHGPVEFDQPHSQKLGVKCDAAKFVVAITSYCRSQIYRWANIASWEHVHIVGCSVGEEWFEAALPIQRASRSIVSVGRLDEQKGQLLLINAFADALKQGADLSLVLIGDGTFRGIIENRIAELNITDSVELLGWCDAERIRERMLASVALVLPSFAEGLPVVIMEAMALKRPVIASRITGIPELVREGVDGWLVTPGDRQAVTDSLLELAEKSEAELTEVGENAQRRVSERHRTDLMVEKLDGLFSRYLSTK